ncbi:hypothetical protein G9A89_004857 [Geosiphon pyriformis]|nr:hypothetical protein G9A89_004857 [Geosiphon pyriformis]
MVAIPINQGVKIALLSICSQPISIAKKGESHCYLGIFLSTEELSKPSVAKAYTDVHFFVNVVLRKAITNKQFLYLVLAVLQPIKCLKAKAHLLHDFVNAALYHSLLYGLKLFEQVQSEGKVAALIVFSNASGILGCLFSHRFLDLQVLGWAPLDLLQFSVRLCINPVNNFLAGVVKIFLSNELFLVNNLPTVFCSPGWLVELEDFSLLKEIGPAWFCVSLSFLFSCSAGSDGLCGLDILRSGEFSAVKDGLYDVWSGFFEVFTNGSLRNAGSAEVDSSTAVYFLTLDLSVGVAVHGLLLSTMAELQAVTLFLECVPSSSTVVLYLDSQVAINACVSKLSLACPDFHNQCWLERHYIFNFIRNKDLVVSWVKVKDHSGVSGIERADLAARAASGSSFSLLADVHKHFLVVEDTAVSEAGPGYDVIPNALIGCINWVVTAKV